VHGAQFKRCGGGGAGGGVGSHDALSPSVFAIVQKINYLSR
jgi:hypothetical protein